MGRVWKAVVLVFLVAVTGLALVFWQPVTAVCKFYRDARCASLRLFKNYLTIKTFITHILRYAASEGTTKVSRRKEKRYVDLAASRCVPQTMLFCEFFCK